MTDDATASQVQADALKRELTERGIVVLAVTEHDSAPGWFTVYLHRPAGDGEPDTAFGILIRLPGVTDVRVNEQTPMIVRVHQLRDVSA